MNKIYKLLVYPFKYNVSIVKTMIFNFHYFPFAIAIKLPVILYRNVKLTKTKGKIILDSMTIRTGMVHLGIRNYGFQLRHDSTIWEQTGGTVIFGDEITIGQGTYISIGENAMLRLGYKTCFGGDDRIICLKSIIIKENTILSWDVTIIDSDFWTTVNTIFNTRNAEKKDIVVGKYNWLCFGSTLLKGSVTPDFCIVGAKTLINKNYSAAGENIVLSAADSTKVLVRNIKWDPDCRSKNKKVSEVTSK